ncbi:ABC transporter substrate-binding protein [Cytobacillus oceanisediminis]|uniref:Multiple sugar transport system substrate-binding protein/alpha-1,4-digalacturonate transport system substrate-binding protein n=1 Tax=Cytobacillus oceanisediminis TaxID=665099 RepID=A0A562J733_9BACI|nr:sugar ABC transporter substrate-binding protein [Cytobacillus oceanisediminis]TWH78893.1 multiple sugar transport system substrate-binding protein/alpha-1,4-digalacturonate transport system substrate-binding protein [Cytobacillus oceanisediminis]
MLRKFKMSLLLSFVLILSMFVSACGGGGSEAGGSEDGKTELRFILNNDSPTLVEQIKEFEQENPDIKVNVEKIPLDQFFEKIETMIAGGRAPDLLYTPVLATQRYANLDLLLDVSGDLSEEEKADFLPSALVSVKNGDKIVGVPHFTDSISVFYNKDLFEKAGVKTPETIDSTWNWEDFAAAAEKVKSANNLKYGVSTGNDVSQFLPFLYQNKGSVLSEDQKSSGINSKSSIESIEYFKSLFDKGLASKESFIGSEKADELFKQGQLPMVITFSGLINSFENDIQDFEYGVTYLPKKEVTATKLGGANIVSFKDTKHPKEAIKLMKYLTSEEKMAEFAAKEGVVPTKTSAQESVDYGDIAGGMKVIINEINSVPEYAVKDFSIPEYLGYKSILTSEMQSVILGEKSPEEAAESMEEQINNSVLKK